ncbi:MAG: Rieske 2Fe-2S domain-containing protein [Kiritimatiellae bacterium]|nr:Rieske 2Fe-2S domain-containing protein [Kiritimatiellia bacterium]
MSLSYHAVGWNRQKKVYDTVLLVDVALYLITFIVAGLIIHPNSTAETLIIRAFGTAALFLLHIILSIGPLSRLDNRFLPLLYNRRHMGVTMFVLALAHGGFALIQFHALGNVHPIVSVFASNTHYNSIANFPFQPLGFMALVIFFLMAATSHDFWLANLTAPAWKSLHMGVYIAYGLIILHVTLGVLQAETSPVLSGILGVGLIWVVSIHLLAGIRGKKLDHEMGKEGNTFIEACGVDDIPEKQAKIFHITGERVAVFRYDGKISAISNVCQHQNGPLGEGHIIDGLVTCPWHGYQYDPETGASPPPFTEKVPTFHVKIVGGRIYVSSTPNPAGTKVDAAQIHTP